MSRVVVWRSAMLPASETFVRAQAAALTRWESRFLGAFRVSSVLTREDDVIVFPPGFLRLRLTGRSPRLLRALRDLGPDLVHAHFGGDGWLISATAVALGVPLIVTLHGHDVTRQPYAKGLKGIRHRRNLRTVLRRAAVVLAVSGPVRDRAIELGADPAKIRVHHTGVTIPASSEAGPKQWDIVFVGRLVEKKGLDDLIAATATLKDLAPSVLIVGDGPCEAALRAQAKASGVDATFAGAQDHATACLSMAGGRIFASPSRTAADGDAEGLPTTILEAQALGVPVVSTVHSGIPEAVSHGVTGLLGAEGDRNALAAHLRSLLTDEELRARMGRQARAHVEAHFDLAAQTARLETLYDDMISHAGAAPAGRRGRHPRTPAPPVPGLSR
ncbi:glycosyltransferase [Winogradskya consettensis]|uniref:Glycosyl transferase family 1 n=1 Tax=Winogradskya consettensis TaxID=113560 RepID=A0A919SG41_9ACTN|nr:glycosyltransferase [Actinoplanes consettensis]GIM70967.1 glycosyl transferase family 1 [Actinoplanes consettensis]